MRINRAEITAVCAKQNQYPADDRQEIAFAGRSNVGKSSLINLLTGRKKLAKISGSPGKTRTINFYEITTDIDVPFRIVDLPGYGYAKVSKSMSADWGRMMEEYFTVREGLRRVILLVDIRHEPTKQDVQMYDYLDEAGRPDVRLSEVLRTRRHRRRDEGGQGLEEPAGKTEETYQKDPGNGCRR